MVGQSVIGVMSEDKGIDFSTSGPWFQRMNDGWAVWWVESLIVLPGGRQVPSITGASGFVSKDDAAARVPKLSHLVTLPAVTLGV